MEELGRQPQRELNYYLIWQTFSQKLLVNENKIGLGRGRKSLAPPSKIRQGVQNGQKRILSSLNENTALGSIHKKGLFTLG